MNLRVFWWRIVDCFRVIYRSANIPVCLVEVVGTFKTTTEAGRCDSGCGWQCVLSGGQWCCRAHCVLLHCLSSASLWQASTSNTATSSVSDSQSVHLSSRRSCSQEKVNVGDCRKTSSNNQTALALSTFQLHKHILTFHFLRPLLSNSFVWAEDRQTDDFPCYIAVHILPAFGVHEFKHCLKLIGGLRLLEVKINVGL